MTSTTQANFDPALKQIYRDANLQKLTFTKRPLFGLLPKFEGFGGRNMPLVLQFGNPQGRSAAFATAQTNRTQVRLEDFVLTRVNNYSIATIDGEVVESTRGDNKAFLGALKIKIDGAMASLADDIESALFRSSSGSLAQLTSVTSANPMVITLLQTEEITNFEVGMTLVANNTDNATSLRATPATTAINGIDRSAGTITTAFDNSGPTTDWAASDFLFVEGDPDAKMSGLVSWLPGTAPSSTLFFGVDRTADTRMSATLHTGTGQPIEESAIDAQSKSATNGGMPDCYFLHHAQVRRLIKELGAKKEYNEINATGKDGIAANVGYRSIVIQGDHGAIDVIAANKCQATIGWMLQKDTLSFNTMGPAVKFLMEDGLRILRQATNDGYEVRLGSRGQVSCKAPIWNTHVTLPNP